MSNTNELIQRWNKMLQGVDESKKEDCVTLLQAQMEYNKPKCEDSQFLRISIPLARRVFSGIQIETSSVSLSKWKAVAKWPFSSQQDGHGGINLNWEVKQVAKLAEEVVDALKENNITKIHNFRLTRDEWYNGTIEVNCE